MAGCPKVVACAASSGCPKHRQHESAHVQDMLQVINEWIAAGRHGKLELSFQGGVPRVTHENVTRVLGQREQERKGGR